MHSRAELMMVVLPFLVRSPFVCVIQPKLIVSRACHRLAPSDGQKVDNENSFPKNGGKIK